MKYSSKLPCKERGQDVYLSIVVPLYNEEESVDKLVARILEAASRFAFAYEIILVDDGSTDGTWERIEQLKEREPNLRGIKFRRNFGQTAAMVAGFENAAGKVLITMDGDLQNDPADIDLLLRKMGEGYDIVSGWRKDRKDHWSRVLPSKVANWLISATTGVRLHDYGCSLKAYRTDCIKAIKAYGEMHRFFPVLASMTGAQVAEVPVRHYARQYGKSKYGLNRIFKVFSDIFSIILIVKFSTRPLIAFTLCAFPFFVLGFFFSILLLLSINLSWTPGKALFFAFSAGLSFMGMIHLIAIGVISELIISVGDHSHMQLPSLTQKKFVVSYPENTETHRPQENL
jgi:glycosyltransferase involved in cell wall biosynthesis